MIAKWVLLGAVGTHVLAASAVSACPLGIDVHLERPRGSPFVVRAPETVWKLKRRILPMVKELHTTGALDVPTVRRHLEDSKYGSCIKSSSASVTFRITEAGAVTNVSVTSDDEVAIACLTTGLGAARMPAADGETFVKATLYLGP